MSLTVGLGLDLPLIAVPSISVLPVISGTVTVGQTLSVTNGTWAPAPSSYAYQWKRAGVAIGAATAATYVLVIADQGSTITCTVTATGAGGSGAATSAATAAVAAYNPLALFSGSYGAWYDPSDLTTLFQDTAATTPVTADGQSVLRINDKSGNGLHLTQATGSKAPLYKTSGGLSWLQFDGVDDFMSRAAVDLTAYSQANVFSALRKTDDTNVQRVFEHGPVVATTNGTFGFSVPGGAGLTTMSVGHRGASAAPTATRAIGVAPASFYGTLLSDLTAPLLTARVNGVAGSASSSATGGGNFTAQTVYLGARAGTTLFWVGNVYQLIFVMKTASAAELANVENHCRVKVGL